MSNDTQRYEPNFQERNRILREREELYMDFTHAKNSCDYHIEEKAAKKAFELLRENYMKGKGPVSQSEIINEFIGIRFDMSAIRHVYASLTRMALDKNAVIVQYPVIDPAQSSGTNLIVVDYAIQMVPIVPESYIEWGTITFR